MEQNFAASSLTDIPVNPDTREISEPLRFHIPREISFFFQQTDKDPLIDDHDYFRKRQAIELARYVGHSMREAMSYRVFSFENAFLHYFGNAKDIHCLTGQQLSAAFSKIAEEFESKLQKQIEAAKTRSTPNPFVPTIERVLQKLGQPEEENKLFRFLCIFQVGPFYDVSNSRCIVGREGRFQPNRNVFRHAGGQVETYCPPTMLCSIFQDDGYLVHKVMPMFRQNSKWVTERLLPAITDVADNACNFNEAMKLVVLGVGLGPSQYHALESTTVQHALGEDPTFLASEAGRAHLALKGDGGKSGAPAGIAGAGGIDGEMGGREDSASGGGTTSAATGGVAGNKLREALQKRDRSKKESVFDVLTMMRHNSAELSGGVEGGDEATSAAENVEARGMMQKAPSAVFVDPALTEDESSSLSSAPSKKTLPPREDESNDEAKMKQPYKNDLEYLEDQFQLLTRERAVIRNKALLHEAVQSGKDGETGGGDDEFDPWGGRRPDRTFDQSKIEGDLRKARTRLTILTEMCKARLRATSSAGSWFPRLELLSDALELTRFEKLVVLDLVKSIISPDREARHQAAFGRNRELSISSLQEKFCSNLEERMACRKSFYKAGVLIREGIVFVSEADFMEDLTQMQVDIDRRMLDFLVGIDSEVAEIVDGSHLYVSNVKMDSVVLPAADKKRIVDVVTNFEKIKKKRSEYGIEDLYTKGYGTVLLFYGPPGTGKTACANAIANLMRRKVLLVNFPALGANSSGKIIQFLFREAKINKAVIVADEGDAIFASRDKGNYQVNMLLTEIERFDGLCIITTNRPMDLDEAMYRRINMAIEFKAPDHILREEIWRTLRPEKLPVDDAVDFSELARRFELSGGLVKNCWLGALGIMVANKQDKVYQKDLETAAQEQIVGRLSMSDFEKKLTPTCGLESLVVSDDILECLKDVINYSKAQNVLMGQWGFAKKHNTNRGISVMMCGPSGTGKTLAASAIGYELGKPLKMVNAAEVMSKWVGETAKNIEAVFSSAKNEDAILVLDEGESLLQHRSDDSSRHDTLNVGILLQQIENFKGICIIITNMKESIDTAFFRRFRFILTFEKPDAKLRKRIWRIIVPPDCPLADDVDFDALADRYDSTGGQIKQIVLRAATRAALRTDPTKRKLFMADLEKSCKEEADKTGSKGAHIGMYV